jgi:hypothetical protein
MDRGPIQFLPETSPPMQSKLSRKHISISAQTGRQAKRCVCKRESTQLLTAIAAARAWRAIMRFSFVGTT